MKQEILEQLQQDRAEKRPVVLATFLKTGEQRLLYLYGKKGLKDIDPRIGEAARAALLEDKARTVETEQGPLFLNVFNPPLRLILVGAVHIAQALVPMAQLAGYEVAVIDPRSAFGSPERFPGVILSNDWPDEAMAQMKLDLRTAVVTLTHDPKIDDPALISALKSDVFYIGALGSKKTHASRLERLTAAGFGPDDFARIHGPVGLSIGAKSPAEIAISILAQMTAALRQPSQASNVAA
ncbi:MAG: XdhC family protein [Ferrovibrio sp.]|jgi:xanthine dehydrogenase accessory factor|uniref:XdhC family protein n=1 Tax=Ferrovibrio sp. TaxID=1917215 RepID=UPI00391CA739